MTPDEFKNGAYPQRGAEPAEAKQPAAPSVPEGFVLVPKEPTREMVSATPTQSIHMTWEGAYRAMLAARPKIMEDLT